MNGKIKLLLFIGVVTTALPILGFSRSIKTIILFILGIGGILLTLSIKRGVRRLRLKLKKAENAQAVQE